MKLEIIEKNYKSVITLKDNTTVLNINLDHIIKISKCNAFTKDKIIIETINEVCFFNNVENVEEVINYVTNKLEQWNLEKYNVWK